MKKFEVGKVYEIRYTALPGVIIPVLVVGRTVNTVDVIVNGSTRTLPVVNGPGTEFFVKEGIMSCTAKHIFTMDMETSLRLCSAGYKPYIHHNGRATVCNYTHPDALYLANKPEDKEIIERDMKFTVIPNSSSRLV